MKLKADFSVRDKSLPADFGVFHNISDGGYERGLQEGKQSEYDRFWDVFQGNGNRTDYLRAFYGAGWNDDNFRPKYDFAPVNMGYMFNMCHGITDLKGAMDRCGVKFDFSNAYNATCMFSQMNNNTRLPKLDWTTVTNTYQAIYACLALEEIEEMVVSEKTTFQQTFIMLPKLTTIRFSGTIASSVEFPQSSLLSGESVQSLIDHLKDLTGLTAQTLTFHADVGNRLTDAQKAAVTAKNWTLVY